MKLSLLLLASVNYALPSKAEIQQKFETSFEKYFEELSDYYTKREKVKRRKVYVHKDEAFALGTALSLDDEDFKVGFNFCDKDENGKITKGEIRKCVKRSMKVMHKIVKDVDKDAIAGDRIKGQLEFDFDRDHKLNFEEFKASNAVLNRALAKTIVDVFDGFNGGSKDGKINGALEIGGMSTLLGKFYSGVGKTSPRKFLSESNIESSTPGEKPSRADRAEITENELCDFLQKMYSLVLENCQADGSCSD